MKASTKSGSTERVIRTLWQLALGAPVSIGALVGLHILTVVQGAKAVGIVAGVVTVVTALHNALESTGLIPAMLRYVPPAEAPVEPPAPPAV